MFNLIFTNNNSLNQKFSIDQFNLIFGTICIGNKYAAKNYGSRFNTVINCTPDIEFDNRVVNKIRIPIDDNPALYKTMYDLIKKTKVLETIHECYNNRNSVLVHCHAGIQRSCCVVACYLIKYHNFTPKDAIEHIKNRRIIAFTPEPNFMFTLIMVYNDMKFNKDISDNKLLS